MRRYRQSKAIRWMTRTVRCQPTRCEGGVDSPLSLIRILLGTARADGRLPPDGGCFSTSTSQINRYNRWLIECGRRLYQPDLEAYRDHLLDQRTTRKRMTTRSVQRMLKRYLISIDGTPTTVTPHDAPQLRSEPVSGRHSDRSYPAESRSCGCQDNAGLHRRTGRLDPCAGECI